MEFSRQEYWTIPLEDAKDEDDCIFGTGWKNRHWLSAKQGKKYLTCFAGSVPVIASWTGVRLNSTEVTLQIQWLLQMDSEVFLLQYACLSTGKAHSSIQNSDISSFSFCFFLYCRPVITLMSYKSCRETWQRKGQRSRRMVRGIFSSWNVKIFSLWENEEARLLSPPGRKGVLMSRDGLL